MFPLLIMSLVGCGLMSKVGAGEVVVPAERNAKWADARCNDGTPFGMTFNKSKTGSDNWVIKVGGGYFCDDKFEMCSERAGMLTTGVSRNGKLIADGGKNAMYHDALVACANSWCRFYN